MTAKQCGPWRAFCARHARKIREASHAAHLIYFATVAAKGPYWIAAGACCLLGIIALVTHAEDSVGERPQQDEKSE